MGKVVNYSNKLQKPRRKVRFDIKNLLLAIVCYCFDSFGAMILLLFTRGKGDRYITFHAAQAMLSFFAIYFAQLVMQTVGLFNRPLGKVFLLAKTAFIIWGLFTFVTKKYFAVPYVKDVAENWC